MNLPITSSCVGGRYARATVRRPNPFGMTNRECEVLEAVMRMPGRKQVAEALGITLATVDQHLDHARTKACAHNTLHLAVMYDRATRD